MISENIETFCSYCGLEGVTEVCPRCGFNLHENRLTRECLLVNIVVKATKDASPELINKLTEFKGYSRSESKDHSEHCITIPINELSLLRPVLELVEGNEDFELYFNGKPRPFAQSLWLPLLKVLNIGNR